jgi:hypothetical protein
MQLGRPTGRLLVIDPAVALDEPDATASTDHSAAQVQVTTTPPPADAAPRPGSTTTG